MGIKKFERVPKGENHITPPKFRDELIRLAETCHGWTPSVRQVQTRLGGEA